MSTQPIEQSNKRAASAKGGRTIASSKVKSIRVTPPKQATHSTQKHTPDAASQTKAQTQSKPTDSQAESTSQYNRQDSIVREDELLKCLVIYTKLRGNPYSADALIAGLPIVEDYLSPELFTRAANRAGLVATFKKRPIEKLSELTLPCILLLKNKEACILTRIDKRQGKAWIIHPEEEAGEIEAPLNVLNKHYLGYAVLLADKHHFEEKRPSLLQTQEGHWFWSTLWKNIGIYRDVLIASVVINIFVLANPLFVKNVYDRIVPNNAVESLWVLAIGVSVVYLFDILLKYLRSYFLEVAGKKADVLMSSQLFEHTLGLKMENRPGSIGSFANNLKEFDSIRSFFTSGTIATLVDLPFVIIFLTVIYMLAGNIVIVPILIILMIQIYSWVMRKPIQKAVEASYEASAQKNAVLIEALTAMETIKALGVEAHSQWKWEQAVGDIARASIKSKMLQSSIARMTGFMQQVSTVVIVLAGVYMIKDGDLSMGGLIATVMLAQRAIGPMGQFANLTSTYQQTKTALQSLDSLMKLEVERPTNKRFIHHPHFEGKVEFIDVSFTYPGETKPAISHVSFKLEPGEKLGIIGRIGSGKSTIEKLILGFYPPTEGTILIDDIDITQLDPAELRRNINYIPQEVVLFKGDVRENIAYRAPYVEDEQILRAAKIAGVDDFVKQHPAGYHLQVGEGGTTLSGGQRQSIGVARALLLDAAIYLFDEPTNAMDANTEQALLKRLEENTIQRTLILVTHKMALLKLVDKLMVMDHGKVVAYGQKDTVLEALKSGHIQGQTQKGNH